MNDTSPGPDPMASFARIGAGVLVYGGAGFLLDRWWGTTFMVGIGIVVGAVLGIYTVLASLRTK
jgi:hypothetical protein